MHPAFGQCGLLRWCAGRVTQALRRRRSVRDGVRFKKLHVVGCLLPVAGEPAELSDDDRVRLAGENALYCIVDLRPVAAAARLILIPVHIDKLVAVVACGSLDARALAVERAVGQVGPLADAGDADAFGWALSPGRAAFSVCCALLVFRIG